MYRRKRKSVVGLAVGIYLAAAGIGPAVAACVQGTSGVVRAEGAELNAAQENNLSISLEVSAVGKNEANFVNNEVVRPESDGKLGGWENVGNVTAVGNIDTAQADTVQEDTAQDDDFLVVIDPGHGGMDEGCSGSEIYEKDINLSIALEVQELLSESGYQVLLTREDDVELSLEERVQMAESAGADAFISIHQNASESSDKAQGIETWCQKEDSLRLARLVQKYIVSSTEADDRGTKEDGDLYVTRETSMPSCLIETGFLSNKEEEQALADEEYQRKIAKGIVKGIDLFFHPRTMYLTFDDGPSAENTNMVLDILAEKNVKATFFVVGENVEKNPEVARRIVREGHTIGIHCNTHDYDVIYESVESYLEDFEAARSIVYEVTGVSPVLFRFPGGSINAYNRAVYKDIIQEMTEQGYIYFDWNASLEDAVKKSTPEQLIENATESTLGRKKVVMLAHDIVYNTTLCLEELIDRLPEYRMEALSPEVEPIRFKDQ